MRYDPERYVGLKPATTIPGVGSRRVETATDRVTGRMVFVLDRKEILPEEDGFALSVGRDSIADISNLRRK